MSEETQHPIEPTEPAFPVSDPYTGRPIERTTPVANPYDYVEIPPPPPPKRKKNVSKLVWIAFVSAALIFCSSVLFYWSYSYHISITKPTPTVVVATSTPVPTLTPTATATPTPTSTPVPSAYDVPTPTQLPSITTAQDIYTQFTAAGIAMGNEGSLDKSWWLQCCSYYPANGSESFVDISSGGSMVVALFGHATAAQDDVAQMDANSTHPGDFILGRCLLLYWSSNTNLTPYEQVMQQYCT